MHSIPNNAWMKVAMVPWAMGGVFFRNRKSRMRGGNLWGEQKSIPVCDIAGRAERLTLFFVLISWLRPIGLASQKIFVKQITEFFYFFIFFLKKKKKNQQQQQQRRGQNCLRGDSEIGGQERGISYAGGDSGLMFESCSRGSCWALRSLAFKIANDCL